MPDPRIPALVNHCCPACGSPTITGCRTVTVVQTVDLRFDPVVEDWDDAGPDALGDTIDSAPWKPTGTCADCGEIVRIPEFAEPAPEPSYIWIVTYDHKHGTDVSAYRTEDAAWAAVEDIKSQYPDEFDEDDPRSWCDVAQCVVNP